MPRASLEVTKKGFAMAFVSIGARQIKAARALLDWSQEDLAMAANLSIATIRKLELGGISPRSSTTNVLRASFEEAGVEFIDSEGVRRRQEEIKTYQGQGGCRCFIEDVVSTTKKSGSELMVVASSEPALAGLFGAEAILSIEKTITLQEDISARIILIDAYDLPISTPRLAYRSISSNYVDPMPFCVYGDKYALVAASGGGVGKIVVVQSSVAAKASKRQFESMWEKAMCSYSAATEKNNAHQQARRSGK